MCEDILTIYVRRDIFLYTETMSWYKYPMWQKCVDILTIYICKRPAALNMAVPPWRRILVVKKLKRANLSNAMQFDKNIARDIKCHELSLLLKSLTILTSLFFLSHFLWLFFIISRSEWMSKSVSDADIYDDENNDNDDYDWKCLQSCAEGNQ